MRKIFVIGLLFFTIGLTAGEALAAEYGPYRYRTGVEQTHMRWENVITLKGDQVSVKNCTIMVMNFKAQPRKCWSDLEHFKIIKRVGKLVKWRDGHETYSLDTKTGLLIISDGSPLAKVMPGTPPWPKTQITQ